MIVALNRARGEDRREPGAVRQCGRGTAAQVRRAAAGESDSISDGFPQDPVSLASLRIHQDYLPPFAPSRFCKVPTNQKDGW
ncbi:MAG: hypothetical protein DMG52_01910 [Acidobacteria bacterium]|nr:MAG: hypothetical protein DMG52_01910 [Acidobacteriota bacterium]